MRDASFTMRGPCSQKLGEDKRIVISNPDTGTIERTIEGAHLDRINSVVVYEGPDGPRIVSAGIDRRIVISDPRTGTIERIIEGAHTDSIFSVAVYAGPEGPRIISAGNDGKIKLWNLEESIAWSEDTLDRPQPINILYVQTQCLAIVQAEGYLICGVEGHLEIYEFVTIS